MLKIPASPRHPLQASFVGFILILSSLAPGVRAPAHAQAAQQPPPQQQQRPRRVGTSPAPAATPAAATPRQTPRQTAAGEEVGDDDVVRVETQLVSVPAVVTDRTGKPLTGLRADNFTVFEDGRPQKIANFSTTEAPFEVALLLDTSGSTRAEVGLIRRAAFAFIEALRPGDRVAIVAFNTAQEGNSKLAAVDVKTPLTDDREELRTAIEAIGASNGTPFYDGLERVAKEIFRERAREDLRGRRALVALTDGVDSTSEADYSEVRARLKAAGVISYFVQVNTEEFVEDRLMQDCQDDGALRLSRAQLQRYRRVFASSADAADYGNFCRLGQFERMHISRTLYNLARQEMNDLARDSGGKTFPVADLQDARRAFRQVADEIGMQYSIGYYSTNTTRDGSFRAIRVQVRGVKDAQVRAREGYQAPKG
ncbi:MAG TPA: VWA domain-containing protein [Pyrinomonadaceae bacterium]|nr:VWA domain-containing protein [Pyrinomonadaceae bacterium]